MTTDTNTNNLRQNPKKDRILFYALILLICFIRFFAFGIKYFPYLDDYIQYGSYHLYSASYILKYVGTVYTRPLAAIFDFFVWSHLNMVFSLIILFSMHFLSAYFTDVSLKKINITLGPVFFIFYFFTPCAFEGLYWISASSRIVTGIFFASLSFVFLTKRKVGAFAFFNLVSYCFYEQVMIYSIVFSLFISSIIFKNDNIGAKKISSAHIVYFIIFLNALIVALYYILFSKYGKFSSRNEICFSVKNVLKFSNLIKYTDASTLFSVKKQILLLLSVILSLIISSYEKESVFSSKKLWLGIVLVFAPMALYLFLSDFPSLRSTVVSSVGAGLVFDSIPKKRLKKSLTFLLCLFFVNAQINMLSNQKATYETDKTIMKNLAPLISEEKKYYLCGAKEKYHDFYNLNITSSNWALTGAMRYFKNTKRITDITPVNSIYDASDKGREILFIFDNLEISK